MITVTLTNLFGYNRNPVYEKEESELNTFFDLIEEELRFKHWYFGHFHADEQVKENYRLLYIDVIPIQP